jgi:hypothetical protein
MELEKAYWWPLGHLCGNPVQERGVTSSCDSNPHVFIALVQNRFAHPIRPVLDRATLLFSVFYILLIPLATMRKINTLLT